MINQRNGDGSSHYHSAQFKVVKRSSYGLSMRASYTIAKSIDNYTNIHFPLDDKLNRGLSAAGGKAIDIPQTFVLSYSYELPVGKGKHVLSSASPVLQAVAGGWAVNGITTFRSGPPLAVTVATSQLNTSTGNRADITCPTVGMPKLVTQWFDTGCFANPAQYVFGNSGIGHVRGPGLNSWDFWAFKKFAIDEARAVEFRAEFFNIFNQAHFNNPGTTLGTTAFGRISLIALPPREIQLGLKLSF